MSNESMTRNFNIANNTEEFMYNDFKVYLMPVAAAAGAFVLAALFRVGMWALMNFSSYDNPWIVTVVATLLILLVAGASIKLASELYGLREFVNSELHLKKQAVISGYVVTGFFLFAMWENFGEWMFGPLTLTYFVVGAVGVALTWAIRRFADKRKSIVVAEPEIKTSFWEEAGFRSTRSAGAQNAFAGGYRDKLKLDPKVTTSDLQEKITLIAKNYDTNVKRIRVTEDPENPNYAWVTVFDEEPFSKNTEWVGPDKPGTSIAEGIRLGTYDVGGEPQIYLAGKNGSTSNHWLVVGMSGSGKSYEWQQIYGSAMNRKEVSVVFIDIGKGDSTVLPLGSGVEWFAGDIDEAQGVIDGVDRAIKARLSWLKREGHTYWVPGCGINFVILHIEEAADFKGSAKQLKAMAEKLEEFARKAREAGISIIYSLQRSTYDNLPTSLRAQLEGRMTFKVESQKENANALHGSSLDAGAAPHLIDVKGGFYITGPGIDSKMAGNMVRGDVFDMDFLQYVVDQGAEIRTPLDGITANAFGPEYFAYRKQVEEGRTGWQEIQRARAAKKARKEQPQEAPFEAPESHAEAPTEEFNTETPKSNKASNLNSDKQSFIDGLWTIIEEYARDISEEFTRADIRDIAMMDLQKGESWVYAQLKEFVAEGRLAETNPGKRGTTLRINK